MGRKLLWIALFLTIGVTGLGAEPAAPTAELRKQRAHAMEEKFLSAGMDVSVYAEGDGATTLRLRYILMSRPFVYKFVNETSLIQNAREIGFRRIVFADGRRKPWIFDISANKFE